MIHRHLPKGGFVDPAGLSLLGDIFDEVCRQRRIEPDSSEAAAMAADLIHHYQAGITDRDELLAMTGKADQALLGGAR